MLTCQNCVLCPTRSILYRHLVFYTAIMYSHCLRNHCWFHVENLRGVVWEVPNFLKLFDERCNQKDIFEVKITYFCNCGSWGYHDRHEDMARSNLEFLKQRYLNDQTSMRRLCPQWQGPMLSSQVQGLIVHAKAPSLVWTDVF